MTPRQAAADTVPPLAGGDADRAVRGMRAHLVGCPACAEDHDSLLEYVRQRTATRGGLT